MGPSSGGHRGAAQGSADHRRGDPGHGGDHGRRAVELLAATSGLGFMIMQAGDYLNTALVFAGIIMIALAGLILDGCLRGLLVLADPSRRR